MQARISTLALVVILTACGGGPYSPTSSSPMTGPPPVSSSSTTPPSSAVTNWKVTQSFASVTGPDNCWVREQRQRWTGAVFPDLEMTITRSAGAIKLESPWFQVNYAGTVSGIEFSASGGPLEGGGTPCKDGTSFTQMPSVSNLSGRFSADDQQMTANEVNSYRLTSGETVTYTWAWQAKRN
jgi:hypothetical protein